MAANPFRGEAELVVGEKTYKLVMDANALIFTQGLLKRKPREMVQSLFADPEDTELVRGLLWGCLQKHHECHVIEAGEILSDAGEAETCAALLLVAAEAYGIGKEEEGGDRENPPTPKRSKKTG